MKDISIVHHDEYEKLGSEYGNGNASHLLIEYGNCEVVKDIMPKGTLGTLCKSITPDDFDIFFVLKGRIMIMDKEETLFANEGDFYHLKFLQREVLFQVIEDTEVLYINNCRSYEKVSDNINALSKIMVELQEIDGDTMQHCERVKNICLGISYYLQDPELSIWSLLKASRFHDVGKIKLGAKILQKQGPLDEEEYNEMIKHPIYTYEIVKDILDEESAIAAANHHEKLDGTGYPKGLKGDEISTLSRIICVADAFDAMTNNRPYRRTFTQSEALQELYAHEGTQFDGRIIKALEEYLLRIKDGFLQDLHSTEKAK